jgi:AraC family transcriptional regulator, positive regulator of tynA and feaB
LVLLGIHARLSWHFNHPMQIVFSTSKVHPRDRLSYWREEASKVYVSHEFSSKAGTSFYGSIRAQSLDVLGLSHFESAACRVERTQRCLRQDSDDDLVVCVQTSGRKTVHQDGRDAVLAVNDMVLVDPRRPFSLGMESGHGALALKVPRRELQARVGDVTGFTARTISCSEPAAAIAAGFLTMLPEHIDGLNAQVAAKIAHQAIDLLALSFAAYAGIGHVALSSRREVARLRLKATIESALCDHTFRPDDAASGAGISVRYANALLAEEGTSLERFIVLRRLQHCHRALVDPTQAGRKVSDIAYSFGFSDLSHFTRRFKAEFGYLPSECRPPCRNRPSANP